MTSPLAASQDGTEEARISSPAAESAEGKDPAAEDGEIGLEIDNEPSADPTITKKQRSRGHHLQRDRRLTAKRKKAYSDLLDQTTKDSDGTSSCGANLAAPLGESRIGVSLWTSKEKELFFAVLAQYGKHDFPKIARSIGSKSETEVRLYLLTLEAALEPTLARNDSKKYISRSDVPAALEVREDCEGALNLAADGVLKEDLEQDALVEPNKHGDACLIDADAAASIDALLEGAPDTEASEGNDDSTKLLTTSTKFFDASILLQLSRSVFMNGPPDGHWNYRTANLIVGSEGETNSSGEDDSDSSSTPPEPAIFRSALSDFYEIAQTVTQKLLHATLFQATSRLRAKDEASPAPVVLAGDVHVAVGVLKLDPDWKSYWARLPRRAGLEVYSDSDKYKRGRSGTKNGVKLTYEEVEAELGLAKQTHQSASESKVISDRLVTGEESADESGSDLVSDTDESVVSSDGIVDVKLENERRKRKRGLSPDSFARAEERFMRVLDEKADREEDGQLRELLGLEAVIRDHEIEVEMPERPKLKKSFRAEARGHWREDVEPLAAWEGAYVKRLRAEQKANEIEESSGESASEDESDSSDHETASNA